MAGGLTVSVRQVASYPLSATNPSDLVLLQQGGLGGPYASTTAYDLVAGALLSGGSLGIGVGVPPTALGNQLFSESTSIVNDGARYWNAYTSSPGPWSYWQSGVAGADGFDGVVGFDWQIAPAGQAGAQIAPTSWVGLMQLTPAGALRLPLGTLSVARDPGSALEVATAGWVGANTVASFNGRRGVVTLSADDISCALGMPVECLATLPQVDAAICKAIQDLISTYPSVWSWQGRVGDVWLTVPDMNWAAASNPPSCPPLTIPTPPATAIDGEVVTAAWVIDYLTQTAGFATEAWVTEQINAALSGTVSSFNGRTGAVNLSLNDVTTVGGAPLASPNFSGIPTAPTANPGTSTAQIATTAFVINTIVALTPGVVSFNTRTGAVTLSLADITNAGGAPVSSPNFTGTPAGPTAAQGTSTSQLATTAFVMNEIAATTAGVVSFNGRSGVVTLLLADITAAGGAPLNNPAFTGQPAAPTAPNGTSTAQIATTAFVMNEINAISAGVTTFNGRSGAVSLTANDVTAVGGLTNPSVALTGTPTSTTPAANDSSTNIATTAFVHAAIANIGGAYLPIAGGVSMTGGFNLYGNATSALQSVPLQQLTSTLTSYAPLASPALSGTPTVPTAAAGTATTQAASTAFVTSAAATVQGRIVGEPNYIDNSGFVLNQRGYASGTALGAGAYGLDRWKAGPAGCTLTFTAAQPSTQITITAGTLQQLLETGQLLAGTYTLSWAGTAQCTAPGASSPAASPITFTIAANATTPTFTWGTGTLAMVKLEWGNVATPWVAPVLQVLLARCQRFYQTWQYNLQCVGQAGNGFSSNSPWPVLMRANPSAIVQNWAALVNTVGGSAILSANTTGLSIQNTVAANGQVSVIGNGVASADL